MKKMTEQELFDNVVTHGRKQNEQALDQGGDCVYRSHEYKACFVGCLIPDELYNPLLERQGIEDIIDDLSDAGAPFSRDNLDLLEDLQIIHDNSNPSDWEDEFESVAVKHGLEYTSPAA